MTHFLLKKLAIDACFFPVDFFSVVLGAVVLAELVDREVPCIQFLFLRRMLFHELRRLEIHRLCRRLTCRVC